MTNTFSTQINSFFEHILGYTPDIELETTPTEINVNVTLNPQESGLLIGHHGEVLTACQLIFSLMYQQTTGERLPVRLNINDYRQQRQQTLEQLADTSAQKALDRHSPVSIGNLTSYERRIIHTHLADRTDIQTYSQGEPPHRLLIVAPL